MQMVFQWELPAVESWMKLLAATRKGKSKLLNEIFKKNFQCGISASTVYLT